MKTTEIKQKITFSATPKEVYDAIMDAEQHAEFTGSEVVIVNQKGTMYSAYDGYIDGKNMELIDGKKIVQTWRANEVGWDDNYYSEIRFEFEPHKNGTIMHFTHTGVPVDMADSFAKGWHEHYWAPMQEMFESRM